jgi:hypothetical protein
MNTREIRNYTELKVGDLIKRSTGELGIVMCVDMGEVQVHLMQVPQNAHMVGHVWFQSHVSIKNYWRQIIPKEST